MKLVLFETAGNGNVLPGVLAERGVVDISQAVKPNHTPQLVMQGIIEVIRCVESIRTGEWPKRLHDVEELEKVMLEKAEHGEYQVVKELEKLGTRKGDI